MTVAEGDVSIGSDATAHIRLFDPSVQPQHAMLEQRSTGYWIRSVQDGADLRVNDEAVVERELAHGDEIDVGQDRLLFQLCGSRPQAQRRRRSKFHGMTFVAVWILLSAQALILAGLFLFWRMDPIPDSEPDTQEEQSAELESEIELQETSEQSNGDVPTE